MFTRKWEIVREDIFTICWVYLLYIRIVCYEGWEWESGKAQHVHMFITLAFIIFYLWKCGFTRAWKKVNVIGCDLMCRLYVIPKGYASCSAVLQHEKSFSCFVTEIKSRDENRNFLLFSHSLSVESSLDHEEWKNLIKLSWSVSPPRISLSSQ